MSPLSVVKLTCLTDPMQLVDELSMIYTTCIMVHASFARGRSWLYSTTLSVFLTSLSIFITGYYHYLQDPLFHQNAYALLTAIVLIRSMLIMELGIRPERRSKERELEVLESVSNGHAVTNGAAWVQGMSKSEIDELKRRDQRDVKILKTMWTMIAYGLSAFLGGFGIWALDRIFCNQFRSWRHEVGLPWGILLEGHGWW
jgi:dihydroceramidase